MTLLIFNRAISDAELKSLSVNPYQIFKRRTWLDRLTWKIKDGVYRWAWKLLPEAWCRKIYGEDDV